MPSTFVHRRAIHPGDLASVVLVSDAQLSPDGRTVAFVRTEIDLAADDYRSTIWLAGLDGGEPIQVTRGPGRDLAPRWPPDGRLIAFLSDRDSERERDDTGSDWGASSAGGVSQVYVLPRSGGEPRRVTSLPRGAGAAVWSPDGTRIALCAFPITRNSVGSLTFFNRRRPSRGWSYPPPSQTSVVSRAQVELKEMIKLEVRVAEGRDLSRAERLIESACARAGLFVRLKRTAAYPGSVHWHIGKQRERGTLEITLWGRAGRIWLKVHPRRTAAWIPSALRRLRTALERRFRGR